jgi:DNA-binding HxlR family transcriptional regulator
MVDLRIASKTEAGRIVLLNPKRNPGSPVPGHPVRGSRTGRPIMALLDLLGRRWTLRVLWELRGGGLGFRELQARCDAMSASVLSRRLAELREAAILETDAAGVNRLTSRGAALLEALGPLDRWAKRWSASAR